MVCITLLVHYDGYLCDDFQRSEVDSFLGIRDTLPYRMCGLMV
jgi:hypothetical protein